MRGASRTRLSNGARLLAVAAALTAAVAGGAEPARSAESVPPNRVTLITDSVGGVLFWATDARTKLARGIDLDLETKTCRKLVQLGCPAYGDPAPPSALDTIESLGAQLGSTVVIDVGYNDQAEDYAAHLDDVMQALLAAGVRQVVWVTLEEAQEQWGRINEQIRAAPGRWPQLTVADWGHAETEPSWFVDSVHMTAEGGLAFADFLRPFVLQACGAPCAPPPSLAIATARLPLAHAHRRYAAAITAHGGVLPYRWSVTGLPARLRLSGDGRISGTPRAAGTSHVTIRLQDAWGDERTVELALRVAR